MESPKTLRFIQYEDEELAALAQQTLKRLVGKTESMVTALSAFTGVMEKTCGRKIKESKREALEKTLANILDN